MKLSLNSKIYDFVFISGSSIICSLLSLIYYVIARRYIDPYDYGIFVSSNLVLQYFNYLQFGVLNSYSRDYPRLLGSQDFLRASYERNNVWAFLILVYSVGGIIFGSFFLFLWINGHLDNKMAAGCLSSLALSILSILFCFFDVTLKSEGRFGYMSVMAVVKTVIMILVGLILLNLIGVYSLFLSTLIALIIVGLINMKFFKKMEFVLEKAYLIYMIKSGAPLLIGGIVWTLMMTIDRFLILSYMSMTELGIYSVGILGFSTMILIPQSISQVFYIKMSKIYGETLDVETLFQSAVNFTKVLVILTAISSAVAYISVPMFVTHILPQYVNGIFVAQILIIGVALYSTSMLFSSVLCILKLNIKLLICTCLVCIFSFLISTCLIFSFGKNINSVAIGSTLSYLLYSLVVIWFICKKQKISIWKVIWVCWMPVLVSLVPTILISAYISSFILQFICLSLLVALLIVFFFQDVKCSMMKMR